MKLQIEPADKTKAKPFLRWAGGKNWLIKHLHQLLPREGFKNYHEPFLGGASVFLSLRPQNKVYLSDLNSDLINTYQTLKNFPEEVINEMRNYRNTEEDYYAVRNRIANTMIEKAAMFIYLNQTSFNGIYRVNLKGEYNVPFGYRTKDFLDADNLRRVSNSLGKAILQTGDFELVKENVEKGDLVFLDPPYTVSHNNNGFIKYNQKLFSLNDQYRLSALIDVIKSKEAYYILTNAAHAKIIEIFDKGDKKFSLKRASLIGGANALRGDTSELVFTNTNLN